MSPPSSWYLKATLGHVPQPTLNKQSLLASQRYELARTEDWVEEEEVEREGCLVLSEKML